jgi:hypothetical protein
MGLCCGSLLSLLLQLLLCVVLQQLRLQLVSLLYEKVTGLVLVEQPLLHLRPGSVPK